MRKFLIRTVVACAISLALIIPSASALRDKKIKVADFFKAYEYWLKLGEKELPPIEKVEDGDDSYYFCNSNLIEYNPYTMEIFAIGVPFTTKFSDISTYDFDSFFRVIRAVETGAHTDKLSDIDEYYDIILRSSDIGSALHDYLLSNYKYIRQDGTSKIIYETDIASYSIRYLDEENGYYICIE